MNKILPYVLGIIGMVFLIASIYSIFVMILWNWLMPDIFGLKQITFLQSWGLTTLFALLFKPNISTNNK